MFTISSQLYFVSVCIHCTDFLYHCIKYLPPNRTFKSPFKNTLLWMLIYYYYWQVCPNDLKSTGQYKVQQISEHLTYYRASVMCERTEKYSDGKGLNKLLTNNLH